MVHRKLYTLIWAITLLVLHSVSISSAQDVTDLSDNFDDPTLRNSWVFFDPWQGSANPEAQSTYSVANSHIDINVPAGTEHDLWVGNISAPLLLQAVPDSDLGIEVKFDTLPSLRYQMHGIVLQEDLRTFIRLGIQHDGERQLAFAAFVDGSESTIFLSAGIIGDITPYYLRVLRSGNNWTFRYSEDGVDWMTAIAFVQPLVLTQAGLYAGNSDLNPAYTMSVDYFEVLDSASPFLNTISQAPPEIEVWYGDELSFGQLGVPQPSAQILGRVSDDNGVATLAYSLNSRAPVNLVLGPDQYRLDEVGDFNLEIPFSELVPGLNEVVLVATDITGEATTRTVQVDYEAGTVWPLPYSIDWSNVAQISDVAQVVDGLWSLTSDGIRTVDPGYNRIIVIGDERWPAEYEITFPVTIHSASIAPRGGSVFGVAVGWQGHEGPTQPRRRFLVEALGLIANMHRRPELRIETYPTSLLAQQVRPDIVPGVRYMFKARAELVGDGMGRLSIKVWSVDYPVPEPTDWDLTADIPARNGSIALMAHSVEVTIGNIEITPLDNE
jgi:hypothetical protein